MKKPLLTALILLFILILGFYCRFGNLKNNVIRDEDVLIYSAYMNKFHEVLKVATSSQFRDLFREARKTENSTTLEGAVRHLQQDPRYGELTASIPETDIIYPDWAAKPAFILAGALFKGICHADNSTLFLTAVAGFLLIPIAFLLGWQITGSTASSLLVSFLVALSPLLVGYSRTGYSNMCTALFTGMALWAYFRSFSSDRSYLLLTTGMLAGVALLFHPVGLIGFFIFILVDALVVGRNFRRFFFRTSHLGIGFVFFLLVAEVGHLAASNISLLFTGRMIKPFLYSLLFHGVSPSPPHPFFYLSAVTLYEGIPFLISAVVGFVYWARQKKSTEQKKACFLLGITPVLLFSLLSGRLYDALRNYVVFLLPVYLIIGHTAVLLFKKLRSKSRRLALFLVFVGLVHSVYALYTNWDNAHYRIPLDELKQYLKNVKEPVIFTDASTYFAELNLKEIVTLNKTRKGPPLFFYWSTSPVTPPKEVTREFDTDVFDHKIFALETPEFMSVWLHPMQRKPYNRILITREGGLQP